MGYFATLWLTFGLSTMALGADLPLSQARKPNENWQQSLARSGVTQIQATTPDVMATWTATYEDLQAFANEAASIRIHDNPNSGNFLRRGPWLYPANGCYAKAAHVSHLAKQKSYPQPGKIYAYGNLVYESPYAKNGRKVYWRYHMAAAYNFQSQVIVIDPGISANPMTESEWFAAISPTPQTIRPKYCDTRSYSPLSSCVGGSGNGANLSHIRGILRDEWSNLARLGYNPIELLGP